MAQYLLLNYAELLREIAAGTRVGVHAKRELFMEMFYGLAASGLASLICISLYCWLTDY